MDLLSFEDLKLIALNFVNKLLIREYEDAVNEFDDNMNEVFDAVKLKDTWEGYIKNAGSVLELNPIRTSEIEGYKLVWVRCEFQMLKMDVQIVFNAHGQIGGLSFTPVQSIYKTPEYVDEESFHELDVTIGEGLWKLAGTITLPNGEGPFPGIVLVHGSGPNDKDETIGPNKTFKDIAWGLASNGIAVLRYDKRTFTHSKELTPELVNKLTVNEEVIEDSVKALEVLHENNFISEKNVFLLGHSLGATLAPRIAKNTTNICGLILMAGITRPLEDTILDQYTYIYSLTGSEEHNHDLDVLREKIERVKNADLPDETPASELPLNIPVVYWKDLNSYNPSEVVKNLNMPILVIQGGRDYQVIEEDFNEWKNALKNNKMADFKLFKDLNHLFISGHGKATPQEYMVEGHVAGDVIETISNWIKKMVDM
jgi:uncharacterized protein